MRVRTRRTHREADGVAHAPHLPVAALVDRDAQEPSVEQGDLGRRGAAVVELHALPEAAERAAVGLALHLDEVLLVHAEARVGEPVGEVAVVGEEQQALGVGVEPAHGEHPRLGGHEVDDGRAALRVARGGDDARRLVEQVVDEAGLHPDLGAVDLDDVDLRVDPSPEHGDLAVHPHPAGVDQVLAHPAAAEAGLGQHLLEADALRPRRARR